MAWLEQYTGALDVRDAREQADKKYVDMCAKHADQRAALDAALQTALSSPTAAATALQSPTADAPPTTPKGKAPIPRLDTVSPGVERLSQLQTDLTAAQKSRAELFANLKSTIAELSQTQLKAQTEAREKSEALKRAMMAERKLKDREEEIRIKAKLIQDVQDEHVSLELQLNMALQKAKKLEDENTELVDRWMKRVGQEADEMNLRSKFT